MTVSLWGTITIKVTPAFSCNIWLYIYQRQVKLQLCLDKNVYWIKEEHTASSNLLNIQTLLRLSASCRALSVLKEEYTTPFTEPLIPTLQTKGIFIKSSHLYSVYTICKILKHGMLLKRKTSQQRQIDKSLGLSSTLLA